MSNSLSMVEEKLPPGFRFHPRDDELICDYLMKKLFMINSSSSEDPFTLLVEVDLNKCEPWDIPERACVGGKEWYFYSQRDRKYATGLRTNRATVSGYWKATGKDRAVVRRGSLVGMRKTLVFYQGRAPKGRKTEWVMHEFRLEGPFNPPKLPSSKEDWVLCRVFLKSRELTSPSSTPMNGYDESGCSSLPDLMDSFISFNQTPHTNDEADDDDNNNNNDHTNINQNSNNSLTYEQVPCFSNQTNPSNSNSAPIFHMAQNQPTIIPAGLYHAPTYNNAQAQQDGRPTFSAMPSGNVGACDRHEVKVVLSHLTTNVKDSTTTFPSPVSLPGGSSAESYLSDVGLPTMSMWTSHY